MYNFEEYGLTKYDLDENIDWEIVEVILTDKNNKGTEFAEEEVFKMLMDKGDSYFEMTDTVKFFEKMGKLNEKDSVYLKTFDGEDLWYSEEEKVFKLVTDGSMHIRKIRILIENQLEEIEGDF